jgi:ABC-type Na+ efflux pump permease subunit
MISGMISLKKKNLWITLSITGGFAVVAYLVNVFNGLVFEGVVFRESGHAAGSNYMFLMFHDGTPYSIFYNMLGGNKVIYPIFVVAVFFAYATLVYMIPVIIKKIKEKKAVAPAKEKELQKTK